MEEPLQSQVTMWFIQHLHLGYVPFTLGCPLAHFPLAVSSSQVLQPYYVLVDALFSMTGRGAIQTLNNSYDPIEELQPERLVYTLRLHFRVVDFQVEWHFVPIETPTLSTTHLNACCVASRLIVTCLNSITTSATISAKSSSSSSILPCRPFTLGSPNMSQKSACTCRIWGGTTRVSDQGVENRGRKGEHELIDGLRLHAGSGIWTDTRTQTETKEKVLRHREKTTSLNLIRRRTHNEYNRAQPTTELQAKQTHTHPHPHTHPHIMMTLWSGACGVPARAKDSPSCSTIQSMTHKRRESSTLKPTTLYCGTRR